MSAVRWGEFAAAAPEAARVGGSMLYEVGLGLGFLATVRPDGGPRVHPICPILTDEGMYGLIIPSPKLRDLRCDNRYALNSETFAPPRHDDAFYLTGTIRELLDPPLRNALTEQFLTERSMQNPWQGFDDQALVEFMIERALVTLTAPREGLPSGHTVWRVS